MFEGKEIIPHNIDWITLVLFVILVLLAIANFAFQDRLRDTSMLFLSKKNLNIYFKGEKNIVLNSFQISLFTVQLLTISLFIHLIISYFKPEITVSNYNSFLIIVALVLLYFGIRFFLGLFLAFIFNLKEVHKKLVYEKINYFNNLILWSLPILIILVYATKYQPIIFKITITTFILLLILRYAIVLRNNKKLIFSDLLYFILYLCALEIAPLVIILKLTI